MVLKENAFLKMIYGFKKRRLIMFWKKQRIETIRFQIFDNKFTRLHNISITYYRRILKSSIKMYRFLHFSNIQRDALRKNGRSG